MGKQHTSGCRPWLKNVACLSSQFILLVASTKETPPSRIVGLPIPSGRSREKGLSVFLGSRSAQS